MDIWRNNVDAILQVAVCDSFECANDFADACASAFTVYTALTLFM